MAKVIIKRRRKNSVECADLGARKVLEDWDEEEEEEEGKQRKVVWGFGQDLLFLR